MKKIHSFTFILLFLISNTISAQKYFTPDYKIYYTNKELKKELKRRNQENNRFNFYYNSKIFKRNDSLISKISIVSSNMNFGIPDNLYEHLNKKIPDFYLERFSGNGAFDSAKITDKPTIIAVFDTSINNCKSSFLELNNLKNFYGDKFNYIAITIENRLESYQFLNENKLDYEILISGKNYLNDTLHSMFPFKILILNKKKELKYIKYGIAFNDEIKKEADEVLQN